MIDFNEDNLVQYIQDELISGNSISACTKKHGYEEFGPYSNISEAYQIADELMDKTCIGLVEKDEIYPEFEDEINIDDYDFYEFSGHLQVAIPKNVFYNE